MGAIPIAAIVICALAGIYLYVMGLCYLCDVYSLYQDKKKNEAEKKRKEQLRMALDQAEMKRKQEMERRKQLAKARRKRGIGTADQLAKKDPHGKSASPAHA